MIKFLMLYCKKIKQDNNFWDEKKLMYIKSYFFVLIFPLCWLFTLPVLYNIWAEKWQIEIFLIKWFYERVNILIVDEMVTQQMTIVTNIGIDEQKLQVNSIKLQLGDALEKNFLKKKKWQLQVCKSLVSFFLVVFVSFQNVSSILHFIISLQKKAFTNYL